jgi:Ca2+-binding EF-hand superfamily protein
MKRISKYAVGAVLVAILGGAAAVAFASPNTPRPLAHELGRGKVFQQYDLNHDGKVTQAEINKVLSDRFAAASGGSSALSQLQFANMRLDDVRKGSDKLFQKVDWNNDGKISREEFLNAEHTRFNRMDRRATGEVSCAPHAHAAKVGDQKSGETKDAGASPPHRHFGFRHARGMGFCAQFDANKDGKVTRAEFDTAAIAQFDKFAKAGSISRDGFYQMAAEKVKDLQTRRFTHLDANHDGKLTLDEFEAPQKKMFARMDKNKDGAITKDEIMASRHHRFGGHGHGDWNKDGKPGDQSSPG